MVCPLEPLSSAEHESDVAGRICRIRAETISKHGAITEFLPRFIV
jgi:hypothetical protein